MGHRASQEAMSQLVLSIFPGIGLLDHAFKLEGWQTVRGSDPIWGGDIRDDHYPPGVFAGIIGGPPCQSFSSLVHLVRANGHEPRFGNLIPEFERCVAEAAPAWFMMENVPQAPEPVVAGYAVKSFMLDNSALDGGDGFGLEQRRVRRFSFGMRANPKCSCCDGSGFEHEREADKNTRVPCVACAPPDLRRWIDLAVFLLPDAEPCVVAVESSNEGCRGTTKAAKTRRQAVLSDPSAVPVKIGGSGKVKRTVRAPAINGSHGVPPSERDKGKTGRYRLADALRLQGLPESFLDHCPFTADGKLKAVANGVPIPLGRAIAKAIKCAISEH